MPITATSCSACAYAFAFAAHLRNSKPPVCEVETSHDWYPIEKSPAWKLCCSITERTAFAIARGSALPAPRSGRSDAIRTSGASPPAATSPQGGAGSLPSIVPPATLTHAAPSPTASACGVPTELSAVTAFVSRSTRETVPLM